jgi:PadR family transcriptional regulator, regulatory protein PadR
MPTTDLLQGTLDLLIFKTLALESMHGWGIAQRISTGIEGCASDRTGVVVPRSSPAGVQGVDTGRVGASENNCKAKYYSLTKTGQKQLQAEFENWGRISTAIALVLK